MKLDDWDNLTCQQTIRLVRKELGMESLSAEKMPCLRCKKDFLGQTKNGKRVQFYCVACHAWQREEIGGLI